MGRERGAVQSRWTGWLLRKRGEKCGQLKGRAWIAAGLESFSFSTGRGRRRGNHPGPAAADACKAAACQLSPRPARDWQPSTGRDTFCPWAHRRTSSGCDVICGALPLSPDPSARDKCWSHIAAHLQCHTRSSHRRYGQRFCIACLACKLTSPRHTSPFAHARPHTMADQLLDQVRDAVEGQIVGSSPRTMRSSNRSRTSRASGLLS